MRASLKSMILIFLLLLAFFLPMVAWSGLLHETKENGVPSPHAFQVIDRYCRAHRMTLNPDHAGPLIISLDDLSSSSTF